MTSLDAIFPTVVESRPSARPTSKKATYLSLDYTRVLASSKAGPVTPHLAPPLVPSCRASRDSTVYASHTPTDSPAGTEPPTPYASNTPDVCTYATASAAYHLQNAERRFDLPAPCSTMQATSSLETPPSCSQRRVACLLFQCQAAGASRIKKGPGRPGPSDGEILASAVSTQPSRIDRLNRMICERLKK